MREYVDRTTDGDLDVLDDLVGTDMVNHASGLQGRDGLRTILRSSSTTWDPSAGTTHHLFSDGDLVTQHLDAARHSPRVDDAAAGRSAGQRYGGRLGSSSTSGGSRTVKIVEHWATRDDMGLLVQVGAGPQTSRS